MYERFDQTRDRCFIRTDISFPRHERQSLMMIAVLSRVYWRTGVLSEERWASFVIFEKPTTLSLDYIRGLGNCWWIGFGNNPRKPKRYNVRSLRRESRPCQFDKESIDISPLWDACGVVALINYFVSNNKITIRWKMFFSHTFTLSSYDRSW